ncbi:MAG: phenyltransferase domain-containing protein [Deltaproteobacteria bacterium]|nr:phenyltransferase domain-containing protein [Deltaproteobacteria bacterium]
MFKAITPRRTHYPVVDVASTAEFILSVQKQNGEIPWSKGGKTDPWDHVESAMGLSIGGYHEEAKKAYLWSSETQLSDGSWWSYYMEGKPQNGAYKDSNMTAYITVGVLHYYLVTGDDGFLRLMWPTICKAMDYVIALQGPEGAIYWAKRIDKSIDKKALLTGSSSIYLSLTCALKISSLLNEEKPHWEMAREKLGKAIRYKPHLFDQSKSRFSMDWYYPILCGVLRGKEAAKRIASLWYTYTIHGLGVRCVSNEPWLTMAETSELVLSLAAIGNFEIAEMVFGWIQDNRYEDGAFWTGLTYPDREIYTTEKTAWTGAAVLLAADILYDLPPASQLFSHSFWKPLPLTSRPGKTK